jgi:hypothetical protein
MNPLKLFWPSFHRSKSNAPAAHMTWASKSLSRSFSQTAVFLKRNLWIWPIIATVALTLVALLVRSSIQSTMKSNLKSQIQTLLNVEVGMLESWFKVQMSNAASLANSLPVRQPIYTLLKDSESGRGAVPQLANLEVHQQIRRSLSSMMSSHDYVGYIVSNKSKKIIAASHEDLIGKQDLPEYDGFLTAALQGEPAVCPPFSSKVALKDEAGGVRTGVPTMFVCAPIRDENFEVVAALGLRIRPELEMTRILQLGHFGETGETYAFDQTGILVSNSRFDNDLIMLGLLVDRPESKSILNVELRDPQGSLVDGYRPKLRRSELPLTKMVEQAIAGNSGIDLIGYRDYRGVTSVGAWQWLPKYQLGVGTEVDIAEALRPLYILEWTFWGLFTLLGIGSIAIFVFTIIVGRLRREAQKASIEARQLGQYTLENKIGAGAMGVVYKGHHSMLRRPTAIKLLDVDKVNDSSIQRFEREVQITCQLNHPNTVAIYDYGRTPEGVFYYAMEYLDGLNLQSIVEQYGPLPEGRVIHILQQLCGSLFEAHSLGLVHRDIKPANLMLNRRGCESDVVKVLDFGLVKAVDEQKHANQTSSSGLTGTPLYMAPESIQSPNSVDGRSDLYAVGAVGYFLLTGTPVFPASSIVELCHQHIDVIPVPPSVRLGKPISEELENAILRCLEKSRSKRPPTARDLSQMLARCPAANQWSQDEAEMWWNRHERGQGAAASAAAAPQAAADSTSMAAFGRTMIPDSDD